MRESKPREYFLADSHLRTETGQEFRIAGTFPESGMVTGSYIHVIEYSAFQDLQNQLEDRTEKYKIAMDKGVDVLSARLAECEKALKEYRTFSLTSEGCGPYENLRFPAEEYFKKWGEKCQA